MTLRIKNWEKFQHYKDRNPPWIKSYYELLTSADWAEWSDASRLLAFVLMLVASRHGGAIPNLDHIKRVAYLKKRPDLKQLITSGFIYDDGMLATCYQDASIMLASSVSVSVVSESVSVSSLEKGGVGGKTKTFTKPTPAEVEAYAATIGFQVDGQKFCDYYESKGWVIGKSPMKDWKACVRTWKSNGYGGQHGQQRTYGENAQRASTRRSTRTIPVLVIDNTDDGDSGGGTNAPSGLDNPPHASEGGTTKDS